LRCRLLTTLAFELDGAETGRGYEASAEAVQMARRLGDTGALTIAINGRYTQTFRYDGLAERRSLGAELLALPGKPVTAEVLAHLMLMQASSGAADFGTADLHAAQAARIADRYDLPAVATVVTNFRALRKVLRGDLHAAGELYRQAAADMGKLGLWWHAAAMSILSRFSLSVMQDRLAETASELEPVYRDPRGSAAVAEMYALALAASGRASEATAVAGRPQPIRRDVFWLFMTAVRGLLGIALDDRERAESAYRALSPYPERAAGADTAMVTLWPTAQILGDLADYLGLPGAMAHYRHALAIAEQARVEAWREAAMKHTG